MLKNRPIVAITIGYIIGIIMGLYCKISIVFLYLILFLIYLILKKIHKKQFKLISIRRYSRYIKIIFTKNICIIIFISSFISNIITIHRNQQIENYINRIDKKEIQMTANIVSNEITKKYSKQYIIKYKNKQFYLNIKNELKIEFGDTIYLEGTFIKPKSRTNYKGFDFFEYCKSQGLYGTINAKNVKVINDKKSFFNQFFLNIKEFVHKKFSKEISNVLLGIILGYREEISEDIKEDFNESNVSHLLAVSGMHIGYLILFCHFIFKKIGKRNSEFFTILIIILFFKIANFSPSILRAAIMAIIMIVSKLLYRKNDIWTTFCLALLCLLIYNPFMINNISLILSFVATFWIILYNKLFYNKNIIVNTIKLTISLTVFLIPISAIYFYKIPVISIEISIIVGVLAGPIFILGISYVLLGRIFNLCIIKALLDCLLKMLLNITKFGSKIPLNKIFIIIPNTVEVIFYYTIIFISIFLFFIYKKKRIKNELFKRRIKNLINLLKFRLNQNKQEVISIAIILVIVLAFFTFIPKKLIIHFIDVGQGDSCLIITPNNKKILIDGGGNENYDVGEKILIPYLLSRKIRFLDYVIISHFDTDHIGGVLTVMEDIRVKAVVISKQGEFTENYKKFMQIVKQKHIKILIVGQGDKLKIENGIYFDILWPDNSKYVSENVLNNNSIVCKLKYKNFSMLFTGDIEEIAEIQLLEKYKNNIEIFNSTILKVAHHGSKTSSTQKFIDAVKPKMALIGVGENNKFGHPNESILQRLKDLRYENM